MANTVSNAINESTSGVVVFNSPNFTASPVTQHYTLVGGASNAVTSVSPSTAGFVLTSNGASADPSFQAVSSSGAFSQIVTQVFTSDDTYTPTSGMKYCIIEVIGGGGGGGGSAAASGTTVTASAGGGAGGYARGSFSAATIGASQAVTIGAGGTAGSAGNNAGGAGGTSSVGVLITATGGGGGSGGAAATIGSNSTGGAGGTGTLGDFQTTGNGGDNGIGYNISGFGGFVIPGKGGSVFFGGSAKGVALFPSGGTQVNGLDGTSYGAGGSGGYSYGATSSASAGGAGVSGIVIITEFI